MNLIICCTPLQVLIAEKIIDLYHNEKFIGVMFFKLDNEKYVYYSNRLKEKTDLFYLFTNIKLNKKINFNVIMKLESL